MVTKKKSSDKTKPKAEEAPIPEEGWIHNWLLNRDMDTVLAVLLMFIYGTSDYGVEALAKEVEDNYKKRVMDAILGKVKLSKEQAIVTGMVTEGQIWIQHY